MSKFVEIDGVTKSLADWARHLEVSRQRVCQLNQRGELERRVRLHSLFVVTLTKGGKVLRQYECMTRHRAAEKLRKLADMLED